MHAISLIELPNKIAILRRNTTQNKKKKGKNNANDSMLASELIDCKKIVLKIYLKLIYNSTHILNTFQ